MKSKNAWIDNDGWCRCGRCSGKLFHVNASEYIKIRDGFGYLIIEIKCHSCKYINEISFCV